MNKLPDIKNYNVVVWGTGKIAKLGTALLVELGIDIFGYCDNYTPDNFEQNFINKRCFSPNELNQIDSLFIFIMVGVENEMQLRKQIGEITDCFMSFYDLLATDTVYNHFFSKKVYSSEDEMIKYNGFKIKNRHSKKIAIYSCVTGKYDASPCHIHMDKNIYDCYMISDCAVDANTGWEWIDANKIIPSDIKNDIKRNRYCKINGCKIFSEYQYSIYLDGNIELNNWDESILEGLLDSGIALFRHPVHDCLYTEAAICIAKKIAPQNDIVSQVYRYILDGMPRHFGQFECGFMVRENNNEICNKIMDIWWNEVCRYSWRDQVSFMYSVWKSDHNESDIKCLGANVRKADYINYLGAHR